MAKERKFLALTNSDLLKANVKKIANGWWNIGSCIFFYYDKEVEYFVKIDDATIYSTKSSKTFTEQQVLMTTGQILDEVHKLRFFVNSDKTVCSVASVVAPYKDYPIDMKSEDILKDYLTVMMNYIIPDNVKMPGVEFHDS